MRIQRRINHTGRIRIDKSRVSLLLEEDGNSRRISGNINFEGLALPPDALVYIEAYQQYALQRFSCGSVSDFALPANARLIEYDNDLPVRFKVKVVDVAGPERRLLAAARGIRASNEQPDADGREKLLPVVSRDLGDVPWRVNLYEDSLPELALNFHIPGCLDRIKSDPLFQALVFPSAIRSILSWIYWKGMIDENEDWVKRWLDFARGIVGEEPPNGHDDAEVDNWIEDVVSAFSRKHSLCTRLVGKLKEEGE